MTKSPQIVAIGLLTQQDLDILGQGFDRAFPIEHKLVFEDLLQAIDDAELALKSGRDASLAQAGNSEIPR